MISRWRLFASRGPDDPASVTFFEEKSLKNSFNFQFSIHLGFIQTSTFVVCLGLDLELSIQLSVTISWRSRSTAGSTREWSRINSRSMKGSAGALGCNQHHARLETGG